MAVGSIVIRGVTVSSLGLVGRLVITGFLLRCSAVTVSAVTVIVGVAATATTATSATSSAAALGVVGIIDRTVVVDLLIGGRGGGIGRFIAGARTVSSAARGSVNGCGAWRRQLRRS